VPARDAATSAGGTPALLRFARHGNKKADPCGSADVLVGLVELIGIEPTTS
jgi:hypothetical protein